MRMVQGMKKYLFSRLFWLALGLGAGVLSLATGLSQGKWGASLAGLGMVLMGCLWFLHPVLLRQSLSQQMQEVTATAMGSQRLRTVLLVLGMVLLWSGIVLRYGFDV